MGVFHLKKTSGFSMDFVVKSSFAPGFMLCDLHLGAGAGATQARVVRAETSADNGSQETLIKPCLVSVVLWIINKAISWKQPI